MEAPIAPIAFCRRPFVLGSVLLTLACWAPSWAALQVYVATPDATADPSATVECLSPPTAASPVGIGSRASIARECARVRCRSDRWLDGEAVVQVSKPVTCALGKATKLSLDVPPFAGDPLEADLTRLADGRSVAMASVAPSAEKQNISLKPLPPGRYRLRVGRAGASWACSTAIMATSPTRDRVFVPWREAVTVRGRVVDAHGRALANVLVRHDQSGPEDPRQGEESDRSGVWACGSGTATESRTDAAGAFAVAADALTESLLVAGGWDDPGGIDFRIITGPSPDPVVLVPRQAGELLARALNRNDEPVACRAQLSTEDRAARWALKVAPGSRATARCDASGRIVLGPVRGAPFEILIRPGVGLPARLRADLVRESVPKDFGVVRIDAGEALRVLVIDDRDAPVPGARVAARNRTGLVVGVEATTDESGIAVLEGLPANFQVNLTVSATGFIKKEAEQVQPAEAPLRLRLERGVRVNGRVETDSGPVDAATVHLSTLQGSVLDSVRVGAGGRFVLYAPRSGAARLQASAPGYQPSEARSLGTREAENDDEIVLRLREADSLRGRVLDKNRRPVSGARVLALASPEVGDPLESSALAATTTGPDGEFSLPYSSDSAALLAATAAGFGATATKGPSGAPESEMELVLPPAAALVVRLDGIDASSAKLFVLDPSGLARWFWVGGRREIRLEGLAPGEGLVAIQAGARKGTLLVAGEQAEVRLGASGRLVGRVLCQGQGAARAVVMLATTSGGAVTSGPAVFTDEFGGFVFEDVVPGTYVAVAEAGEGRTEKRVTVGADDDTRVELELNATRLRVLAVDAANDAPVPAAKVSATPRGASCSSYAFSSSFERDIGWSMRITDGGCAVGQTGADGVATLGLARSGPFTLDIRADGFEGFSGTHEAVEGITEFRARLQRGGPPRVKVVLESDQPVAGAIYCLQGRASTSSAPVSFEAECDNFVAGPAAVAFRARGYGFGRTEILVPEHGLLVATIRVLRGGDLVLPMDPQAVSPVRVLDESGMVWNQPSGLGWPECGLGSQAEVGPAYVCLGLPAGPYVVEVGGRPATKVVIEAGQVVTVY